MTFGWSPSMPPVLPLHRFRLANVLSLDGRENRSNRSVARTRRSNEPFDLLRLLNIWGEQPKKPLGTDGHCSRASIQAGAHRSCPPSLVLHYRAMLSGSPRIMLRLRSPARLDGAHAVTR